MRLEAAIIALTLAAAAACRAPARVGPNIEAGGPYSFVGRDINVNHTLIVPCDTS